MLKTIFKLLSVAVITVLIGSTAYISASVPGGISGFWTMVSAVAGLNKSEEAVDHNIFDLPEGFKVDIVAENLGYARFILVTKNHDMIVSIADAGQILLLQDKDGNGTAETHSVLIDGLEGPQGLVFDGDWLYFSESGSVSRVLFDQDSAS